jgi:hypothetical protein
MSGEGLGPGPGAAAVKLRMRAMAARAEAEVLLGEARADLTRWAGVLAEVEQAVRSDSPRTLDEHAELVAARNRLFNVMAEIAELVDPFLVWAAVAPDEDDLL